MIPTTTTTTPVSADTPNGIRPLPEALSRQDNAPIGEWSVGGCGMVRGEPMSDIANKRMVVPYHDHPTARVVRAHEMVHAKVSPMDISPWIERGNATEASLRACEEYRVNHLVKKAGFDTNLLLDGSERLSAERLIATDDWAGIVHLAFATAGTGAYKEFMKPVKKHKPVWAKVIDDIVKRANREVRKSRFIGSTESNEYGLPEGFEFTERIAEWCDRLGAIKPPEPKPEPKPDGGGSPKPEGDESPKGDGDGGDTPEPPKRKRGRPRKDESAGTPEGDTPHSTIAPVRVGTVPSWFPLAVTRIPTPIIVTGAIGKKRVASNTGRHPRRLHRLLTDPQKRVFDRVVRGKGGVIAIDCSGSMHLSESEVKSLTEVSCGATVLAYTVQSWGTDSEGVPLTPNAWVLSERGRMANLTDGLPFHGMANGVDLPALRWAVANRKHPNAPVVWVCDGAVTGKYDNSHPLLAKACYDFVKKHRIILVPNVESAIHALRKLGRGENVTPNYRNLTRYLDGEF